MNKKLGLITFGILLVVALPVAYVAVTNKPNDQQTSTQPAATNAPSDPPQSTSPSPSANPAAQSGTYVDYTSSTIASTKGTKLLFFHAPWCPQCRSIEADIKQNGLPDGVTVIKVDYDTNQSLRQKYGVTIQTTFVKVDDTGNKVDSYVAYEEPWFSSVQRELLK